MAALEPLATVGEPAELVDGVLVARAAALIGLERYAEAVVPLQAYLASPTRGADIDRCRARLAIALAQLDRWSEVEPVVAQLRESHADNELYWSTIDYLADVACRNKTALAETLFAELAQRTRHLSTRPAAWRVWRGSRGNG